MNEISYEYCSNCECEVEIEEILQEQICPNCKNKIMACSFCQDEGYICDFKWLNEDTKEDGYCMWLNKYNIKRRQ